MKEHTESIFIDSEGDPLVIRHWGSAVDIQTCSDGSITTCSFNDYDVVFKIAAELLRIAGMMRRGEGPSE